MSAKGEGYITPVVQLPSLNGTVTLYRDRLVIHTESLLARLLRWTWHNERTFALAQIEDVVMLQSGFLMLLYGYLKFTLRGTRPRFLLVVFHRRHERAANQIKENIQDWKSREQLVPYLREKLAH